MLAARYMLFRRLRSTCDLLMMPKEVLTDRHIREEVVPGLSVHKIMLILERFQPDDYASEGLPHGAQTRPCVGPGFELPCSC